MLLLVPVFLIIHLRQGAPINRFPERLGFNLGSVGFDAQNQPTIWFHAASLGEVKQIQKLTHTLMGEHQYNVLITTFTHAGADWVVQNIPNAVHKFAPIDLGFCVSRFLRRFNPKTLAIIEGDIWPILLHKASKFDTGIALLNARNSKSRKRFARLHTAACAYFDMVTCPNTSIQEELIEAGVDPQRISIVDSLKTTPQNVDGELSNALSTISDGRKILTIASTHASDEATIEQVVEHFGSRANEYFIIWAPRHLRRTKIVSKTFEQANINHKLRSDIYGGNINCDALILDTLGELSTVLSISSAVYLGGGLGNEGGHNPFEPAQFGRPIASGSNIKNHREAFNILAPTGAIQFVTEPQAIIDFFLAEHVVNPAAIKIVEQRFSKSVSDTSKLLRSL